MHSNFVSLTCLKSQSSGLFKRNEKEIHSFNECWMKLLYFSSHLCFCMQTHTRYLLFISFLCLCHLVSIQEPFSTQLLRVFWEIITEYMVNWFVVVLQNKLTDWQAWNRSQIFIYHLLLFSENDYFGCFFIFSYSVIHLFACMWRRKGEFHCMTALCTVQWL